MSELLSAPSFSKNLERLNERFVDLLAANKLPHAILLSGEAASSELVQRLVLQILCTADTPGACHQCASCRQYLNDVHPDYVHVHSEEDKAIKIDQIRALIEFAHKTASNIQGRRVILIEDAHAMNESAANSLLKVLEAPPEDVYFILASAYPNLLIQTIRSRCQHFQSQGVEEAAANQVYLTESFIQLMLGQTTVFDYMNTLDDASLKERLYLIEAQLSEVIAYHQNCLYKKTSDVLSKAAIAGLSGLSLQRLFDVLAQCRERIDSVQQGIALNANLCLEALLLHCAQLTKA